jgi:p24 family protein delta-1
MEGHFFNQMLLLSKSRKQVMLPLRFLEDPSEEIKSAMDSFITYFEGEIKSGCQLKLSNPESSSSRTMDAFWFTPLVINHVRKAVRARRNEREASPLEGYSACLTNHNDDYPVHVIVDSVLTSEEYDIGDDAVSEDELQVSHLTPLAEQLAESMAAAKSIINEMNFMERRESRMRLTADSINARVRYFSYISVGVLLIVTYIQVTYLKRYFRKKKLL